MWKRYRMSWSQMQSWALARPLRGASGSIWRTPSALLDLSCEPADCVVLRWESRLLYVFSVLFLPLRRLAMGRRHAFSLD